MWTHVQKVIYKGKSNFAKIYLGNELIWSAQTVMYEVWLISAGSEKLKCIAEVKNITGLGLKEAKTLVDSAPISVYTTLDAGEAELIRNQLESSSDGAVAEIRLKDI